MELRNTLKNNRLILATAIFFLLINTIFFWEGKLGIWNIPIFLLLIAFYIILVISLVKQLIYAIQEKFVVRKRLFTIPFIITVLILIFLYPRGIINFENFEGKDLLVIQSEGAANCTTTFKFKENNKYIVRNICFGVTETKGSYKLKGDTIFFTNIPLPKQDKQYYKLAIIRRNNLKKDKNLGTVEVYKNIDNTKGHIFSILVDNLSGKQVTENNKDTIKNGR